MCRVSSRGMRGDSLLTVLSLPGSRTLGDSGLPGSARGSRLQAFIRGYSKRPSRCTSCGPGARSLRSVDEAGCIDRAACSRRGSGRGAARARKRSRAVSGGGFGSACARRRLGLCRQRSDRAAAASGEPAGLGDGLHRSCLVRHLPCGRGLVACVHGWEGARVRLLARLRLSGALVSDRAVAGAGSTAG